jgi:hypothetical protein
MFDMFGKKLGKCVALPKFVVGRNRKRGRNIDSQTDSNSGLH